MRSLAASKTGAASSSVWAKMSETKIEFARSLGPIGRSRFARTAHSSGTKSRLKRRRWLPDLRQSDFCQLMLVGIADDQSHAGQRGDLFRGALRVTSGDHDSGLRILAADAADGGARILIGAGRDGAGIQDDDGSLRGDWKRETVRAPRTGVRGRRRRPGWRGIRNFLQRIRAHSMVAHTAQTRAHAMARTSDQAEACGSSRLEAFAAKDRAALRRAERNGVCFPHPEQVA